MTEESDLAERLPRLIDDVGSAASMTASERAAVADAMWASYRAADRIGTDLAAPTMTRLRGSVPARSRRRSWRLGSAAAVVTLLVSVMIAVSDTRRIDEVVPSAPAEIQRFPIRDDGETRRWRVVWDGTIVEFDTSSDAVVVDGPASGVSIVREGTTTVSIGDDVRLVFVDEPVTATALRRDLDAEKLTVIDLYSPIDGIDSAGWSVLIPSARADGGGCAFATPCVAVEPGRDPDPAEAILLRAGATSDVRLVSLPASDASLLLVADRFGRALGSTTLFSESALDLALRTLEIVE